MKTITIESLKNGNLISKKQYKCRTTWEDLSLKHFIAYMAIVHRREMYLKEVKDGVTEDSESEQNVELEVFSVDMIAVLTGVPKELLYSMNVAALVDLHKILEFTHDKLPQESDTLKEFWFRSATEKRIAIWENDYKRQSYIFSPKKKTKVLAELTLMKKSHFTLKAKIDDMEFKKYISSNKVLKQIKKIQGEMKNQDFSHYAQLIAYIVDKNGVSVDISDAQKLGVVFEDLPFCTAYKIVNFFLNLRSVLSSNTKRYLTTMMETMEVNLRQRKSKI